jgi:hypothetical protein
MKALTTLALTLALTGGAAVAQAADQDQLAMSACRAELQAYYGEDARFDLVSQKRYQHGTRMKVAVHTDTDSGYFATCWVDEADLAMLEEEQTRSMLATTAAADGPTL